MSYEPRRVPPPKAVSLWTRIKEMVREWFTNNETGEDDSEAMWEADPRLFLTVMSAASALAEEYDICHKDICVDMAHLGAEMLKDAGYDAFVMCHSWRMEWNKSIITVPAMSHCWVRVDTDWHVDFGAVQFPELAELPYPLITHREGALTAAIYGEGASQKRMQEGYERLTRKHLPCPLVDVSKVLKARTLEELKSFWKRGWIGDPERTFFALQKFRMIMDSLDLTEKGIPILADRPYDI